MTPKSGTDHVFRRPWKRGFARTKWLPIGSIAGKPGLSLFLR
jgi:hypothetical protein